MLVGSGYAICDCCDEIYANGLGEYFGMRIAEGIYDDLLIDWSGFKGYVEVARVM